MVLLLVHQSKYVPNEQSVTHHADSHKAVKSCISKGVLNIDRNLARRTNTVRTTILGTGELAEYNMRTTAPVGTDYVFAILVSSVLT